VHKMNAELGKSCLSVSPPELPDY